MGHGILKAKKKWKLQFNQQAIKEINRLQAENEALKSDPNSVVSQFLKQYNEVVQQNQKLHVLACSFIKMQGGKVTITKEMVDSFMGFHLYVKIETSDGVKDLKDAKEYIFTYEAVKNEPVKPVEGHQGCTDPNCTLPKDLIHSHDEEKSKVMSIDALETPIPEELGKL